MTDAVTPLPRLSIVAPQSGLSWLRVLSPLWLLDIAAFTTTRPTGRGELCPLSDGLEPEARRPVLAPPASPPMNKTG